MPNWCNNSFKVEGDKESIDKFEAFLNEKNGKDWFDFFAPTPVELKEDGWYEWNVSNWGCKWNCDANNWTVNEYDDENLSINFWFDSPWGPPTELYQNIYSGKFGEGFNVFAEWHEEGMCFVGKFEYGDVESYDYTDLDSLDGIPEDLVENWNLREMLEDREEWDEDDEEVDEDWDPKAELDKIVVDFDKDDKE